MTKITLGVALVAIVIAIGSYFHILPSYGNATGPAHEQIETFKQGLQIGLRGSEVKNALKGACSLIASNYSVAASTSVSMDCAITGVRPGDLVFAAFATTTQSTAGPGWEITRSSASSTNDFATLNITNGTGATAIIPPSLASSSVQYLILR